jgi:antibiotic biosynthesis monooxygenase (ABM) superfamily enzyme
LDKGSPYAEHISKEVTIVISRKVKPGYENEYDAWLRRYLMLEKKVPGYVGATIIK